MTTDILVKCIVSDTSAVSCEALDEAGLAFLGSSFFEALIPAAIAAILGAFSAYLFNKAHWKNIRERESHDYRIETLCGLVCDLEATARDYWSSSAEFLGEVGNVRSEITLKSQFRLISRLTSDMRESSSPIILLDSDYQKLKRLLAEIYDHATGGDFESASRQADMSIVFGVALNCVDLRARLLNLK